MNLGGDQAAIAAGTTSLAGRGHAKLKADVVPRATVQISGPHVQQ